jgi:hypothetical protein
MNIQTGASIRITQGGLSLSAAGTTNYTATGTPSFTAELLIGTSYEAVALPSDLTTAGCGNLFFQVINPDPVLITAGTIELALDNVGTNKFAKLTLESTVALIPAPIDSPTIYAKSTITGTGSNLKLLVIASAK